MVVPPGVTFQINIILKLILFLGCQRLVEKEKSSKWAEEIKLPSCRSSIIIPNEGLMHESYTLLSKIHANADVVLGLQYILELEGNITMRDLILCF